MSVDVIFPLLHKYVLSPVDDDELKMAKLRYRLCVQEVAAIQASPDRQFYCRNVTLRSEESGIEFDSSHLLQSSCQEDNEDDDCAMKSTQRHLFHDESTEYSDTTALMSLSSTFDSLRSKFGSEHAIENDKSRNGFIDFHKCTDVRDALAILTTHNKLANISARKTVLTRSAWKISDLVKGPLKYSSVWQNPVSDQINSRESLLRGRYDNNRQVSQEVQDTRNKILEKEIEIADLLKKILESMESEPSVNASEGAARPKENSNAGDITATNRVLHASLAPTPNSGLMETNAGENLKNLENGEIKLPVKEMENMEPPMEEIILRHDDENKDNHNKNDRNKDSHNKDDRNIDDHNKDDRNIDDHNKEDRNIDDHNKEDRNIDDHNREDRNIDDHNKEDDHKDNENKDPTTPKKKRKSIFRRASNAIRKRFSK